MTISTLRLVNGENMDDMERIIKTKEREVQLEIQLLKSSDLPPSVVHTQMMKWDNVLIRLGWWWNRYTSNKQALL
jgi:hypothetical protein